MSIFSKFFASKTPLASEPQVQDTSVINPYSAINFATQNEYIPSTSYQISNGMVKWDKDNLFPLKLVDLYNSSPIHSSITLQKSLMICGNGIKYNNLSGLTTEQQLELSRFEALANGCDKSLMDIATEISLDYQIFGNLAIEVVWDLTFSKIIKINRIPAMNVRIGAQNKFGKVDKYFFNKDWTKPNTHGTITIAAFDLANKTDTNQLIYLKNPSLDDMYYGSPTYASALNWIAADAGISKFHLSNISNGMAPSLKIQFYKVPTPEQKDEIVNSIKREYTGQNNAGKVMVLFSDGKDNAPTIEPIQVTNLDKQFLASAQSIVEQIIRGHRATSGVLWGVASQGNILSQAGEIEASYKIFEQTVLSSDRKKIEQVLNRILKINGLNADLYFEPYQINFNDNTNTSK